MIEFAVNAMPMYHVWLMLLEDKAIELEQEEKNKKFWSRFTKDK